MSIISVIVPVYNVEAYLHRCVNSILNQVFSDFELILVDDGSPDSCGVICDEYAEKDSRIHVIHQKNGGLSAARNAGIDWIMQNSDSQWITFVDSDDWIHPEMLERLITAAWDTSVKVSVCGFLETSGETIEPEPVEFSLWEPENFYVQNNVNAIITCGKLYHRDCFIQIRFPVGKLHEDEFTTYKILFKQKRIAVTSMPMYYYYQNAEGITKSGWTPRRLDSIEATSEQIEFFQKEGFKKAYNYSALWYVGLVERHSELLHDSDFSEEEKERYQKWLRHCLKKTVWKYWPIYLTKSPYTFTKILPCTYGMYKRLRGKR